MQKIATRVFICASLAFGFFGILLVLTIPAEGDNNSSDLNMLIMKCVWATVFVILPSFALSIAGKYLNSK
jgi:hypothetical protein